MKTGGSRIVLLVAVVVCVGVMQAQTTSSTLSGTVKSESGQAVSSAKVSVKSVATGQTQTAETNSAGQYSVTDLPAGEYEVAVSAPGYSTETQKVTLAAGATQALDVRMTSPLSLSSLGFPKAETKGNAREQALLNKRSHMLQMHQKLGLITAIPMTATLIASTQAGGRHSSSTGRNVHMALGSATAGMYFTTAYFAIFAPKVPGMKKHGPTRFHEAMAFIHGPGMVLTPILGGMAASQLNQGQRVHGIASAHGAVAVVTAAAFGLALISETKPSWLGLGHKVTSFLSPHHTSVEQAEVPPAENDSFATVPEP
jgi:hypothetical protein